MYKNFNIEKIFIIIIVNIIIKNKIKKQLNFFK